MRTTLNLIKLNCNMERFAEVFGDCIETADCVDFFKEATKIDYKMRFKGMKDCASPDELFDCIDWAVTKELNKRNPQAIFKDRGYFLLRAFYRFCHDAYLWEDCEDLQRWEEELFDSLSNIGQKNYTPCILSNDELGRETLFLKYCDCIASEIGIEAVPIVCETVKDWRESTEGGTE